MLIEELSRALPLSALAVLPTKRHAQLSQLCAGPIDQFHAAGSSNVALPPTPFLHLAAGSVCFDQLLFFCLHLLPPEQKPHPLGSPHHLPHHPPVMTQFIMFLNAIIDLICRQGAVVGQHRRE